jgi:CheY-like chemotaxis protein
MKTLEKKKQSLVLLADDDEDMRKMLAEALRAEGCKVTECKNGIEFISKLESFILKQTPANFDIIISDIRMPGVTGMEILEDLNEQEGLPPMILITGFGDSETHQLARKYKASAILDKPFEIDTLIAKVREILAQEKVKK